MANTRVTRPADVLSDRRVAVPPPHADAPPLQEPLAGYIFVCNNETMEDDLKRELFGLPQKHHESVRNIQTGMPIFLYNYSARQLHGVFEASSEGGLNIEPNATKFPAQVRVRLREKRPALDESMFRKYLFHYDGPKFRLELSQTETNGLLRLFGAVPEEAQGKAAQGQGEGEDGDWETVKPKSRGARAHHGAAQPFFRPKRGSPPNGQSWRAPQGSSATSSSATAAVTPPAGGVGKGATVPLTGTNSSPALGTAGAPPPAPQPMKRPVTRPGDAASAAPATAWARAAAGEADTWSKSSGSAMVSPDVSTTGTSSEDRSTGGDQEPLADCNGDGVHDDTRSGAGSDAGSGHEGEGRGAEDRLGVEPPQGREGSGESSVAAGEAKVDIVVGGLKEQQVKPASAPAPVWSVRSDTVTFAAILKRKSEEAAAAAAAAADQALGKGQATGAAVALGPRAEAEVTPSMSAAVPDAVVRPQSGAEEASTAPGSEAAPKIASATASTSGPPPASAPMPAVVVKTAAPSRGVPVGGSGAEEPADVPASVQQAASRPAEAKEASAKAEDVDAAKVAGEKSAGPATTQTVPAPRVGAAGVGDASQDQEGWITVAAQSRAANGGRGAGAPGRMRSQAPADAAESERERERERERGGRGGTRKLADFGPDRLVSPSNTVARGRVSANGHAQRGVQPAAQTQEDSARAEAASGAAPSAVGVSPMAPARSDVGAPKADAPGAPAELKPRRLAWQGNDAAILKRLAEPQPTPAPAAHARATAPAARAPSAASAAAGALRGALPSGADGKDPRAAPAHAPDAAVAGKEAPAGPRTAASVLKGGAASETVPGVAPGEDAAAKGARAAGGRAQASGPGAGNARHPQPAAAAGRHPLPAQQQQRQQQKGSAVVEQRQEQGAQEAHAPPQGQFSGQKVLAGGGGPALLSATASPVPVHGPRPGGGPAGMGHAPYGRGDRGMRGRGRGPHEASGRGGMGSYRAQRPQGIVEAVPAGMHMAYAYPGAPAPPGYVFPPVYPPGAGAPLPPQGSYMVPLMGPIAGFPTFPMPPAGVLGTAAALHKEILEYADAARPPREARLTAQRAVGWVQGAVKTLWGGDSDVEVFGSYATGLALPYSDIDVAVVNAPPPPIDSPEVRNLSGARISAPLIRQLASFLQKQPWCESLYTIETARIPVIKLQCNAGYDPTAAPPSPPPASSSQKPADASDASPADAGLISRAVSPAPVPTSGVIGPARKDIVKMDITIALSRPASFEVVDEATKQLAAKLDDAAAVHNGAPAREFVIERLKQYPALAPLILLMKSYLHHRGLKDVYTGGLGSFSLTMMLVFYLERAPVSCGGSHVPPVMLPLGYPPQGHFHPLGASVAGAPHPQQLPLGSSPLVAAQGSGDPGADTNAPAKELPAVDAAAAAEVVGACAQDGKKAELPEGGVAGERGSTAADAAGSKSVVDATEEVRIGGGAAPQERGEGKEPQEAQGAPEHGGEEDSATGAKQEQGEGEAGAHRQEQEGQPRPVAGAAAEDSHRPAVAKGVVVDDLLATASSVASPHLGVLLLGFLHLFGQEIDLSKVKLILRGRDGSPGGVFWQDPGVQPAALWVDDPLQRGSNIGSGSFAMWHVQAALREMLSILTVQPIAPTKPAVEGSPSIDTAAAAPSLSPAAVADTAPAQETAAAAESKSPVFPLLDAAFMLKLPLAAVPTKA